MSLKKGVKNFSKKFWFLFWKDDSLKGWIFSLIALLIFIQLILFPTLRFATGTELPLAIVESCSMHHKWNFFSGFNNWWERHEDKYTNLDITKNQFEDFNLNRGFSKGDILFIVGAKPEKLKVGDIILFDAGKANPVIHRIIKIQETQKGRVFSTIGDNNNGQLSVEKQITEDKLVGKAVFRIAPYLGWGKLIFFEPFREESERGLCNEN